MPRHRFSPISLDALNFLLADLRGALGPCLNVFLVTQQNWSQATGTVAMYAVPFFWPIIAANCLMSAVGDVFGPAVAASTLGLFPRATLARRVGCNSAFDHAGKVAIAVLAVALLSAAMPETAPSSGASLPAALAPVVGAGWPAPDDS